MRTKLAALVVLAVGGVPGLMACGSAGSAAGLAPVAGSWREFPDSPLSPRVGAVGIWTGREVLLIGGRNGPLCPPNARCVTDGTPLADGAALDPRTGHWRRITDAPVPLSTAPAVVIGETVYLLPTPPGPDAETGLLAYEIDEDRWQWLPVPFDADGWYAIAAAGDHLVAYLLSDETRSGDDYLYDPVAGIWQALPPDPLGPAFGRTMVWTGHELVLLDHELVPNPGSEEPAVTRAAALDLAAGSWRRLPDSEILGSSLWLVADGILVNPGLGSADGGEVNNWGRPVPYGGRLDPATGQWSLLPDPPAGVERAAGAHTDTTAVYAGETGAVLDTTSDRWLTVPPVPEPGSFAGRTVVAAGADLLVFGGVDWAAPEPPVLSNRTWLWPPG